MTDPDKPKKYATPRSRYVMGGRDREARDANAAYMREFRLRKSVERTVQNSGGAGAAS